MIDIDIDSIKEVVRLARISRIKYEKDGINEITLNMADNDLEEILKPSSEEEELENYLMSLHYETIKDIMAIMYLGRDQDYDKLDTQEEIYKKYRKYFEPNAWEDKETIIDIVTGKVMFDKYLENGLKILNIK